MLNFAFKVDGEGLGKYMGTTQNEPHPPSLLWRQDTYRGRYLDVTAGSLENSSSLSRTQVTFYI